MGSNSFDQQKQDTILREIYYAPSGRVTYLFCLNVVDVASRYKASIPIGATSVKNRAGILTSHTIAKAFEHIYDNSDYPLVWPKLLITDKGSEFKGECERLMKRHGVEIQKATSKRSVSIVERPIGYDEPRLSYRDNVRYLLEPGELEGGQKRRGTDMNWSPEVYNIGEVRLQKNQPVLYKLLDGPERRFVREELLLVNDGLNYLLRVSFISDHSLF
ncbi:unnamed protein product [Rhizophagus irregularis]|uniref:Integrase catalytic domain-containing protein n=1 Tax=Rhizophagus irregularis TaxID=588596 RepID=A0A915Z2A2_9GLOM|nr:unnamed protein product [Rhizophagus irregularis]